LGGKFEGVAISGGLHAHLPQKDIEKKVNFVEQTQDAKKKETARILFLYYELIVCPLLLNYNKVHLASSLIAKTYCVYIPGTHVNDHDKLKVDTLPLL
jgi:hypothetical protein